MLVEFFLLGTVEFGQLGIFGPRLMLVKFFSFLIGTVEFGQLGIFGPRLMLVEFFSSRDCRIWTVRYIWSAIDACRILSIPLPNTKEE